MTTYGIRLNPIRRLTCSFEAHSSMGDAQRIHFPTRRVSLEAVIRLLIQEFKVPPRKPAEFWRSLLSESEAIFLDIAHQSRAGPSS